MGFNTYFTFTLKYMLCPKREKSGSTAYFAEVLFLYTVTQYGGLWGIVVGTYLNFLKMFWCTSRARTHIIAKVKKVFCNNHVIAIHLGGR